MVIIVCAAMFGEYVVIDMVLKGHFWVPDKNWRYIQYNVPKLRQLVIRTDKGKFLCCLYSNHRCRRVSKHTDYNHKAVKANEAVAPTLQEIDWKKLEI